MLRILVVCTGNTCRSPMAAALLQQRIRDNNLTDKISVLSAGLSAGDGVPASYGAVHAMGRKGIDLTTHRSSSVSAREIGTFELVLTMTGAHKQALTNMFPEAKRKVYTFAEYAGEAGDVLDPYGGNNLQYQACAREIENKIDKMWGNIVDLAGKAR